MNGEKKGFTLIELLIVICIFLIMLAFLTPLVQMARERAQRIDCAYNLMQISLGLHKYAVDHNDAFPPSLGALYPNCVEAAHTFDCPASKTVGSQEKPDYDYVPGLTESSSSKEVIVHDIENNHNNRGRNVLRIDGSIEWVSAGKGKLR